MNGLLSIIADILAIVGFSGTCYELFSFKRKLDKTRLEVSEMHKKLNHLVIISDMIRQVELIQEHFEHGENKLALYRLVELNKVLNEIRGEKVVAQYARANFDQLCAALSDHMFNLREALRNGDEYDSRFINEKLQFITDNLQLVQKHLKN